MATHITKRVELRQGGGHRLISNIAAGGSSTGYCTGLHVMGAHIGAIQVGKKLR